VYHDWCSYKDLFKAIINDNPSLTAAQKMQYLKTSLKGEAACLIQSMKVTEDNYAEAWRTITARYENKREIVQSHLKKLFQQPIIHQESATKLKQLVDTTNECVRALKVLGVPVQEWDTVLVYLCSERLDPKSRRRWALQLKGTDLSPYKEFEEFMEQHIRGLMAVDCSKPKQKSDTKSKPKSNESSSSSKTAYTTSQTTSSPNQFCNICKESHLIYKCEVFLAAEIPDRLELVKKHNLCFNCLGSGHSSKNCNSKYTCRTCKKKHHSLLHMVKAEEKTQSDSTSNPIVTLHVNRPSESVHSLMSTAIVKIKNSQGSFQPCRVLIDSAADSSFITEKCVQRLGLKRQFIDVSVSGIGAIKAGPINGMCDVELFSNIYPSSMKVEVLILPKLTELLPRVQCANKDWPHLKGLKLADPTYFHPREIDILLGIDVYGDVMTGGKIAGEPGSPTAFNTIFGWVLTGKTRVVIHQSSVQVHHVKCNINELLQKFWEIEGIPTCKHLTNEEKACEEFFDKNHTRDKTGRFTVKLPLKDITNVKDKMPTSMQSEGTKTHFGVHESQLWNNSTKSLGVSRQTAVRRLQQVERRLQTHPEQQKLYNEFMDEYVSLGHMEIIPKEELGAERGKFYYLPHHHVLKPDSLTTKLRVVFDASAKTSSGVSLNDIQLVGPKLQDDLFPLLLRFRSHVIALTSDITKMYRQVKVDKQHTDFQRIVWRKQNNGEVEDYRLLTVTYGTASAPYLAVKCLQRLAECEWKDFPLAAPKVLSDFYVDDLMSGASSQAEALQLQKELNELSARGGFELRKWASNDPALLIFLPPELIDSSTSLAIQEDQSVKTLGVM